ncbi:MAG: hypothetical protein ACOX0Z_04130 [Candidatus Nanosyncoccaceae bacterium]|jgi:hypothetical protein
MTFTAVDCYGATSISTDQMRRVVAKDGFSESITERQAIDMLEEDTVPTGMRVVKVLLYNGCLVDAMAISRACQVGQGFANGCAKPYSSQEFFLADENMIGCSKHTWAGL